MAAVSRTTSTIVPRVQPTKDMDDRLPRCATHGQLQPKTMADKIANRLIEPPSMFRRVALLCSINLSKTKVIEVCIDCISLASSSASASHIVSGVSPSTLNEKGVQMRWTYAASHCIGNSPSGTTSSTGFASIVSSISSRYSARSD